MEREVLIEFQNIVKTFGSTVANDRVSMDIRKGEILSVLGENGCGKTTLMNMLAGIYYPDSGKILIGGEEVSIRSPKDAFAHKIGMVHQHFKLIDVFSAAENVVLGVKDDSKYNLKDVKKRIGDMCDRYGFHINPDKKIYEMSVSEKQTVEIIKVLYRGADILILDEPTAVLTPQEIQKLFAVLRTMRNDGKSIIIITHKLNEVMEISDRVAVLRKGEHIATVETALTNEQALTEMMVGKKVTLNIERTLVENPQDRLIVRDLNYTDPDGVKVLNHVSFVARSGEILGIAGIAGSGQRELLEAIAGLQQLDSGEIIFNRPKKNLPVSFFHKDLKEIKQLAGEGKFHYEDGTPVDLSKMNNGEIRKLVNDGKILFNEDEVMNLRHKTPLQIREIGVRLSFVPEDRLGMGLVGNMDIIDNMMLRSYRKGNSVFLNRKRPEALATDIVNELEVVTPDLHTQVRKLSGGNVQKVLVGREISSAPKVLMAAYPVRGLDINSSYSIYHLLNNQKTDGAAVIFVGEDLDVLLGLCDRILVMNAGKVTGILDARTVTKEEVGFLMTKTEEEGGKQDGSAD